MKTNSNCLFASALILTAAARAVADLNAAEPARFQEVFTYSLGDYWCENHLATADFDRDGKMDIVLMTTALRSLNGPPWSYKSRAILLHNEGDGTFTDSIIAEYTANSSYGYFAAAVDANIDGAPDLVLRESVLSHVLLNDGTGRSFREVSTFRPGYSGLVVGDMNRNGWPDLVSGTQTQFGGQIQLFTNTSIGTTFAHAWGSRFYGVAEDSIKNVVIGNLNGDDWPDIAAQEIYSGLLVTLHSTNNGSAFLERNLIGLGDRTFALAGGNVNGDSLTDLAVHVGWGNVRVFTTRADGSLSNAWQSPQLGQAAFNLALADFDRDGLDDVFVGTFGDGALRIFRNNAPAGFEPWWTGSVPGDGYTGSAADLNGDGYPDLIVGEMNGIRILTNSPVYPPELVAPVPPLHLAAAPGETVTLSAAVSGTLPIFARWRRFDLNGTYRGVVADQVLTSQLGFLVLTNVNTNLAGTYTLHLTNCAGGNLNLTHTNAFLTVRPDSDVDGLPDDWELTHALRPDDSSDAGADSDKDTQNNRHEYIAGTDPLDPKSCLRMDAIELADGGASVRLRFLAVSNRTYTVQWRRMAGSGSWNRLADVVAIASNRLVEITDSNAPQTGTGRVYRLTTPRQE